MIITDLNGKRVSLRKGKVIETDNSWRNSGWFATTEDIKAAHVRKNRTIKISAKNDSLAGVIQPEFMSIRARFGKRGYPREYYALGCCIFDKAGWKKVLKHAGVRV